jgi:hypothetical protein
MGSTRIRSVHAAVAAIAALVLLIAPTGPAAAEPAGPADATGATSADAYLAKYPGGVKISPTEVSYANGTFIVTTRRAAGTLAGPDCPSGWFCFYDGVNYGYPRGKLSSCGWQDLATFGWSDRTESAHYNLNTGNVWFINHTGGGHAGDVNLFNVGVGLKTRSDVAPNRNIADHVNRTC